MKNKPLRALLIKRNKSNNKLIIEDTKFIDTLDNLYKLLECSTIDIQERCINGIFYDFIIDDEYLLNGKSENPRNAVAIGTRKGEILEVIFHSVIICHSNENGEETDLNEDDIKNISKALRIASTDNGQELQIINYNFEEE